MEQQTKREDSAADDCLWIGAGFLIFVGTIAGLFYGGAWLLAQFLNLVASFR